jgi:hypothetical protein
MNDPLVSALAAAAEQVLTRGVSVTVTDGGWIIRLEPSPIGERQSDVVPAGPGRFDLDPHYTVRRTW